MKLEKIVKQSASNNRYFGNFQVTMAWRSALTIDPAIQWLIPNPVSKTSL
ncbi:MAG: hypothetical protein HC778_02050 [Chamaesiphon sp. CSU_1_12]|nr:hypothetical protein [Chamaesiphon sp. CSU_1_12]